MTVKELIEYLETLSDKDLKIVVSDGFTRSTPTIEIDSYSKELVFI